MTNFSIHPLDAAMQRVGRAQEHFCELQRHIAEIRQNYAETTRIYFDPSPPHECTVYPPPKISNPPIISIVLGEICYNLRSALDYLIFELARQDSGAVQDGTQFPIDHSPEQFEKNKRSRLKGLSVAHIAAIEGFQPYKACNWTKVLRDLSNPDKHRALTDRGLTFNVEVRTENLSFEPHFCAVRQVIRPDGVQVKVEFVGYLNIDIPIVERPDLSPYPVADDVELVTARLISEVRDLLEAFKPELQPVDMMVVRRGGYPQDAQR
jgi:hypothetical protein